MKSVSLTASYISSDVLAINLSITSVSGRCNALENTQNTTILPNLQTLTTTSAYYNACCINVSKICADLKITVDNVSGRVALITSSFINISSTIDSVLFDNTSFKNTFTNINASQFKHEFLELQSTGKQFDILTCIL